MTVPTDLRIVRREEIEIHLGPGQPQFWLVLLPRPNPLREDAEGLIGVAFVQHGVNDFAGDVIHLAPDTPLARSQAVGLAAAVRRRSEARPSNSWFSHEHTLIMKGQSRRVNERTSK